MNRRGFIAWLIGIGALFLRRRSIVVEEYRRSVATDQRSMAFTGQAWFETPRQADDYVAYWEGAVVPRLVIDTHFRKSYDGL